jgi:hypothetical protein
MSGEEWEPTPEDMASEMDARSLMGDLMREETSGEFYRRLYARSEWLSMVTIIGKGDRYDIVLAKWYAEAFGQDWLDDLVDADLMLRVSIRGKGREQAVQAETRSQELRQRSLFRFRRGQG